MNRFEDQVAIVIGGARGIGKAVAKRLLEESAVVHLIDISKIDLEQCQQDFKSFALQSTSYVCDICDEGHLKKVVKSVVDNSGRLDILVNSTGIIGPSDTKLLDYPLDSFEKVMRVNLTGAFIATKTVLPQMIQQKYGRIVHLTSIGGKDGNPGMVGYVASKSGLIGLIKGVGKEYAQSGITINGVAPAVIATPMNIDTAPEMLKYMTEKIPMGRMGTTDEVASIVSWLVSKEASFNTGAIFDLSGGRATY